METKWSTQTRIFVISILLIALVLFLYFIHDLLRPVVIASLLGFMLYPLATFLRRRTPLTQKAAGVVVFFTFLAILAIIPAVVTPVVIGELDSLGTQAVDIVTGINDFISQTTVLGYHIFSGVPQNLQDSLTGLFRPDQIYGSLATITENVVWVGVIMIMLYYLLVDWVKARNVAFEGIPNSLKRDAYEMFKRLRDIWDVYLRGQLLMMLILGVASGIAAAILGLPGAIILGLVAAGFGLVPSVGSSAYVVVPGLVAMFTQTSIFGLSHFWYVAIVVGVFASIHLFENYWLRPRILGHGLGLHPAVILVSVIGALTLGGGLFALVVVPMIRTVGVILRYLISKLSDQDPWEDAKNRPTLEEFFEQEGLEPD
jgi:predicted PurR-regulated permease PerM